jgi:putative Ca2+/H+ antiporter (TMEM165/GDT1 family)
MIKTGYIMLAAYVVIAVFFWASNDLDHAAMFMAGGMLWIIGVMVWYKVQETEK